MSEILKRTSFGLLRTNPKLTTNVKIISDSKDKIYLESIDASPYLSKSIYKGFEVSPNGSYSFDLKRFYSGNGSLLSKDIAYTIFEKDPSTEVKTAYELQYDFTYDYGFEPKNSKIYPEEFSMFAPLWLERDNVPGYFVIFRMDGPSTINTNDPQYSDQNLDESVLLKDLVENPENFFNNIIKEAKIIKTFDLSNKTSIGKYITNHINDPNFPESPLTASLDKDALTYWNGMSYDKGGFSSKSEVLYKNYTLVDKSIIESDDIITDGFKKNSIICANLLNLEFLFDDDTQEKYKFYRYFGIYVNEIELGKFILDPNRLYDDKDNEITQTPAPQKNIVGSPTIDYDFKQINTKGIKIYPKIKNNLPYSGRLLTFDELQNSRLGYVKNVKGKFYSINQTNDWSTTKTEYVYDSFSNSDVLTTTNDTDFLRIKDTSVSWKDFSGFENPFGYIQSKNTSKKGRSSLSFKLLTNPTGGDEIRIKHIDWSNPEDIQIIDAFTIRGTSGLPAGTSDSLLFSINGTIKQAAFAISKCINEIGLNSNDYTIFSSVSINDEVIIFSRVESETWDKIEVSFFSDGGLFPYFVNEYLDEQFITNYQPSPVYPIATPLVAGNYLKLKLSGGNNNPKSRAIIEKKFIQEFKDNNEDIYIKTKKGYQVISKYSLYLDEPIYSDNGEVIRFNNYEKYYVINLSDNSDDIDFGSSSKLGLYKLAKNSNGYLSILPIKDFDFDFHNTDYKKQADSDIKKLNDWYFLGTGGTANRPIIDILSGSTGATTINNLFGPTAGFIENGGYFGLFGYQDDLLDSNEDITNEYDRLKENTIPVLALSSRIVPFINKWVYDNESVDVRENPYRLTTDQSFGYLNFSPSFDNSIRNAKFFTHEWYYLQKYPPYMTFDEKVNSFSYFDNDINFPVIPKIGDIGYESIYLGLTGGTGANANLLSIEEDYFKSYFTRESVDGLPIVRDFKYSIFNGGTLNKAAETLFRGAKVEIVNRSEFSTINYNKNSLRYLYNKKYNGYRFSCVLTYGEVGTQITCIKNDKWKSVTMVIQINLDDPLISYLDSNGDTQKFIDRTHLYTLESSYNNDFTFKNSDISGLITDWTDNGEYFEVFGGIDSNGNLPNYTSELSLNEFGSYNTLNLTNGPYTWVFEEIYEVSSTKFRCRRITGLPLSGLIPLGFAEPNGNSSLNQIKAAWIPPLVPIYTLPLLSNPDYQNGGFNEYNRLTENISFTNIANSVNLGDPEVRYINVNENGVISFNEYTINLIEPDYPMKASYLKREVLDKTTQDINESANILGYRIGSDEQITLSPIARYRGNYSPKWRDVLKFIDTTDLKNEGLDYFNIQILDTIKDQNGNVYLTDQNLGLIKNLYFNKVNVENPNLVLSKAQRTTTDRFIYPLLGEIAIDYADFYTFKSNWDPFYYRKYVKRKSYENVIGTREPNEDKSFFGSKTISIPNRISLETFPDGFISKSDIERLNSSENIPETIIVDNKTFVNRQDIELEFLINKSLENWLLNDGFSSEFIKYINPNYTFGDVNLDDDIKKYVKNNILERYNVKEIIFWEKVWNPIKGVTNPNQIEINLYDYQKIEQGYLISKNFKIVANSLGGLDFKLIYTVPSDKRTSISFSVILEKK